MRFKTTLMRYTITFCLLTIFLKAFTQNIPAIDSMISKGVMGCGIIKSAEPTNKPVIVIRCRATLQQGQEPLIIIDGILTEFKRLNDLDPNDIESVYILKDASATAIYGCRASNGVIIITTKNSNLREFIIKDFLDGSKIAGATVTFISQDEKKDTLMFVANDSGMVITDALKGGKNYEITVSSTGYRTFSMSDEEKKSQDVLLERDVKGCNEVMITSYVSGSRCGGCRLRGIRIYGQQERIESAAHANLYPNPVQKGSTVTIDLKTETNEDLQLKIFSLDGRLLLSQTKNSVKGNNRFTVQADNRWAPGTYLVHLSDAKGKIISKDKLVIQ
jgi:TonB-dependent SusC/RagA subfamily outer membrane receptor